MIPDRPSYVLALQQLDQRDRRKDLCLEYPSLGRRFFAKWKLFEYWQSILDEEFPRIEVHVSRPKRIINWMINEMFQKSLFTRMERLVRFCVARKAGTSFRNRDGVYRNKGMAISGKLALCSMARSINNGTGGGEIQIRTRERVFTPQLFYRRVYVLSRRCSFHARQSRDYARTSAYVRTVSTPSPRQNPFFHGWNMWEGEGADRLAG